MPDQRQDVVDREPVPVMFKRVADEQAAITAGWEQVEAALGELRGRRFYGVFAVGEYRVCVQLREGDDPSSLGLETGMLPGGRYARVRLRGDPPGLYRRIAPEFEQLAQRPDRDDSRPGIEYYRRHDVIDLLQPIS